MTNKAHVAIPSKQARETLHGLILWRQRLSGWLVGIYECSYVILLAGVRVAIINGSFSLYDINSMISI